MIVVEGTIRVANMDLALPHMRTMVQASRAESGCVGYSYAVDILDLSLIHVSERWRDRAALTRHLDTDHIKAWRAAWAEIGVNDRSLRLYEAEPEDF